MSGVRSRGQAAAEQAATPAGLWRPSVRAGSSQRATLLVVVLAFCAALPFLSPTNTFQFTIVLAMGLAGLGVALLLEGGLISFGHALFYGIGGYAVAVMVPSFPNFVLLDLLIGAAAGGVLAAIAGLFMVRYRGVFFAMLNLALSMVAYALLLKSYTISGGSEGLAASVSGVFGRALAPAQFGRLLFYVSLVSVIIIGVLLQRYRQSAAGFGLGAVEDREIRTEYLGISANRLVMQAYIISGVLCGLGGAIAASAVGHVAPDSFFWTTSTALVVVAVLGGRGVVGPFLGAALYELLSIAAARYLSNSWEILLGAVILLVIRFAPNGFSGLPETWRATLLNWRRE